MRAAGEHVSTGRCVDPTRARWKLFAVFAVLVFVVACCQRILLTTSAGRAKTPPLTQAQLMAVFNAIPEADLVVGEDDPVLGSGSGPVQIVVFSEFQCPACQRYARVLRGVCRGLSRQGAGGLQTLSPGQGVQPDGQG